MPPLGELHRVWFVFGAVDVEYPLCCGSWRNIGQLSVSAAHCTMGALSHKKEKIRTISNKLEHKLLTQLERDTRLFKLFPSQHN